MASATSDNGEGFCGGDRPTLTCEYKFHQYVVFGFLRLERAAVEASGSVRSLLLLDQERAPSLQDTHQRDRQLGDGLLTTETPLLSIRRPHYVVCPRNRFCRYISNLTVLVLLVATQAGYYYMCLGFRIKNDFSMRSVLRLDVFALLVFVTFWFAAPIHTALGYFSKDASLSECRENKEKLLVDTGARFFTSFSAIMILLKTLSDLSFFVFRNKDLFRSNAMYILYTPFAALLIVAHFMIVLSHLLLIVLAMRGILARLKEIDGEIGNQLDIAFQQLDYSSDLPDHNTMLKRWSRSFNRLGQDMQQLSTRFGPRMVFGLALFLVATTSIISMIWQSSGENWARLETIALLLDYTVEASMLMMAVSSVCYPVTMCTQFIGPKLVVVASAFQELTADDRNIRMAQLLANGFLLAPIEMSVGNFEVLPSVSTTVAGILVGLLLFALGYNVPF